MFRGGSLATLVASIVCLVGCGQGKESICWCNRNICNGTTCTGDIGCFETLTKPTQGDPYIRLGCLTLHVGDAGFVQGFDSNGLLEKWYCPHEDGTARLDGFNCCYTNYCNGGSFTLPPTTPIASSNSGETVSTGTTAPSGDQGSTLIIVICVLAVAMAIFTAVMLAVCVRLWRAKTHQVNPGGTAEDPARYGVRDDLSHHDHVSRTGGTVDQSTATNQCENPEPSTQSDSDSYLQGDGLFGSSIGDGAGRPLLVLRTVGREISWLEKIGAGKFGEVWKCHWRGRDIAVKCSTTRAEYEWKRECQIYESRMLRHDNILGFIAADVCDRDGITEMILLTEYHRRGSLYSVLQSQELTMDAFLRLVTSAANGLSHLHSAIHATKYNKPSMAHRDIKSKNILVKDNGEACLCDLGLGVIFDQSRQKGTPFDVKVVKVGTRRYMSPEILQERISRDNFEEFKAADTYSFSLVLWETARRCNFLGVDGGAYPYLEPFGDYVPDNPNYEEMIKVAVTEKIRPTIPHQWKDHPIMQTISRMCRTCWSGHPGSRFTMSRVFRNLVELRVNYDMREESADSGIDQQTELYKAGPQDSGPQTQDSFVQFSSPARSEHAPPPANVDEHHIFPTDVLPLALTQHVQQQKAVYHPHQHGHGMVGSGVGNGAAIVNISFSRDPSTQGSTSAQSSHRSLLHTAL